MLSTGWSACILILNGRSDAATREVAVLEIFGSEFSTINKINEFNVQFV